MAISPVTSITASIGGKTVARDEVLQWEEKRFKPAARRIGLEVPTGPIAEKRLAFADEKLALGEAQTRRRLARDLRVSDIVMTVANKVSRSKRAVSVCDLTIVGGDAEGFAEWFNDSTRSDYRRSMLAANPDHYLIDIVPDGRQEVIETTGSSPMPTHFFVDYSDTAPLKTVRDLDYPTELAGVALDTKGVGIGGVRHELRNTPEGFQARLQVEFPSMTPPWMVNGHRWHLACEFSNWVELASKDMWG